MVAGFGSVSGAGKTWDLFSRSETRKRVNDMRDTRVTFKNNLVGIKIAAVRYLFAVGGTVNVRTFESLDEFQTACGSEKIAVQVLNRMIVSRGRSAYSAEIRKGIKAETIELPDVENGETGTIPAGDHKLAAESAMLATIVPRRVASLIDAQKASERDMLKALIAAGDFAKVAEYAKTLD
jgi:hypothetical protein